MNKWSITSMVLALIGAGAGLAGWSMLKHSTAGFFWFGFAGASILLIAVVLHIKGKRASKTANK